LSLLRLMVHSMAGDMVSELHVPPCTKVCELKRQIRASGGPVITSQVIVHAGSVLDDSATVQDCGIAEAVCLQLACVSAPALLENIKVVARCRPMSMCDIEAGHQKILQIRSDGSGCAVSLHIPGQGDDNTRDFTFDAAFDEHCSQQQIFETVGRGIVDDVMDGYNGTIMSYGQTGAGKSFTIFGSRPDFSQTLPWQPGLLPRSFDYLFARMTKLPNMHWNVCCSFIEIHNEEVRDLLSNHPRQRLQLKEHPDGVYVKGLINFRVNTADEIHGVFARGHQNSSASKMDAEACRTATIFTKTVESRNVLGQICRGKLNMVECKGSERLKKSATGDRLKDAAQISMTISALRNVISALVNGKSAHIPYRDSKFTRLLKDSLGGNAKTVFIANLSPVDYNYDETMGTLRFAYRAKSIQNKPAINVINTLE